MPESNSSATILVRSVLIVGFLLLAGCGSSDEPPPDGQLHIEAVADCYQQFKARRGQSPPDEKAFAAFIIERFRDSGIEVDIDDFLRSPQDGQKYVINYKPNSNRMERNVAVYEQQGSDGQRWLAFDNKWSERVDNAQLKEYLARK